MKNRYSIELTLSMLIFGTIGLFIRNISFPSGVIAFLRGIIGAALITAVTYISGKLLNFKSICNNLKFLSITGTIMGFNWILLFEAYRYTSVATATLCYYLAPVFVTLLSPFLLGERLTAKKSACSFSALVGMVFVSGVIENGIGSISEIKGILLGIGAAVLYSCVIISNRKYSTVGTVDRTVSQLVFASVALLVYSVITKDIFTLTADTRSIVFMLSVGIVHTGVAYLLYFDSVKSLKAQTTAILSYIDPVVAIILSTVFLKEKMTVLNGVGAVIILGSALLSEISTKKAKETY